MKSEHFYQRKDRRMKTNALSDNTHTATGSKNDPTKGPDKGPNPEFQEAYGVGQGQAGKSFFSGKVLSTAIWAFFSLVIKACIVASIIGETMGEFCPDSKPLQEYWEINDNLMKDLIGIMLKLVMTKLIMT